MVRGQVTKMCSIILSPLQRASCTGLLPEGPSAWCGVFSWVGFAYVMTRVWPMVSRGFLGVGVGHRRGPLGKTVKILIRRVALFDIGHGASIGVREYLGLDIEGST